MIVRPPNGLTPPTRFSPPNGFAPPTGIGAPYAYALQPAGPGTGPWGVQARLAEPREPAYLLFALLLAICGLLFAVGQLLYAEFAGALILSWVLVLLYAAPVALLVYRLDLFEREPAAILAAALAWGAIVATTLAVPANAAWLSVFGKVAPTLASDWGAAVVGPGVEEPLKLMGVVTLYLIARDEFDGILDGFVYGAMVGLGFTVVEDLYYFMNAAAAAPNPADQISQVVDVFLVRVVAAGLYGHVLFTALAGIGFAYLVTRRTEPLVKRLAACAAGIVLALAAHFFWNSPLLQEVLTSPSGSQPDTLQWMLYAALKGGPFLILLGLLVWLATRSEEKTFRAIVAGEPAPDVISEAEIETLRTLLSRRRARRAVSRAYGPDASRLVGRLQKAQIDYAMVRARVHGLDDPAVEAQRMRIRAIRAELAAMPPRPGYPAPIGLLVSGPRAGGPGSTWSGRLPAAAGAPEGPVRFHAAPAAVLGPTPVHPAFERPPSVAAAAPGSGRATGLVPASVGWLGPHTVPPGGLPAWADRDPSRPPVARLPEFADVEVEARSGAWAQVRTGTGWRGWVDGRRLLPRR